MYIHTVSYTTVDLKGTFAHSVVLAGVVNEVCVGKMENIFASYYIIWVMWVSIISICTMIKFYL